MLNRLNLAQLQEIIAAKTTSLGKEDRIKSVGAIATDSRSLQPGEVFLALRGEKFDGHEFASLAVQRGAIAIITERPLDLPIPQLQVNNTLQAYQAIARWWRNQFSIPVIAVTGSVGKTTTKELIAAVLSTAGNVLKTELNYNNEIGVPKTLLELTPEHDFAIIEMGMRGRGQIAELAQIAQPTIGIITNVGTAHIGILGSEEAIAQAKCELLAEMPPSSIAILNADNQLLMDTAATVWQGKTISYGLKNGDFQGKLIDNDTLLVAGQQLPLPLNGQHNTLNYLAALAVAQLLNISWQPLAQGLNVILPDGRAKKYELPNDVVILDETYNAGLESMLAALQLLAQTPGKRRIAVLGTMKELGERSPEFHQRVGEAARQLNLDGLLVLVDDPEAAAIALGAQPLATECFRNRTDLVARLKELIQAGDRLLFKASHSVGLDSAVNQLRSELG